MDPSSLKPQASSPSPTRGDVTISIGADGRVYFHDLDQELIELALAVNPDDKLMRRRLALCRQMEAEQGLRLAACGWKPEPEAPARDEGRNTLAGASDSGPKAGDSEPLTASPTEVAP
jgi:hypothetical protein